MEHRRERNLAALERHAPEIARHLRTRSSPADVRLVAEDGDVNLDTGAGRLYPGGARAHAAATVAAFVDHPSRLQVTVDRALAHRVFLNPTESAVFRRAENDIGAALHGRESAPPDAFFLICKGVGLGFHLREIVERVAIRHLFLIEPIVDFLAFSLRVFDWAAFLDTVASKGIRLHWVLSDDVPAAADAVARTLRGTAPAATAGALTFTHYAHPFFERLDRLLATNRTLMAGWGYLDDEMALLSNTVTNLIARPEARFIQPPPAAAAPVRGGTAVVAASGPSLVKNLEALRAASGHAVVFSCGSALKALLDAGVRPDFQVEKERESLRSFYIGDVDTRGMGLMTSTTILPGFCDAFAAEDVFFYVRPDVTPELLLAGQVRPLVPGGGKVDHNAVSLALALGAARIVLVGIDLGTRDPARHHAEGTPWKYDVLAEDIKAGIDVQYRFDTTAPGNLGGAVHTTAVLQGACQQHEAMIRAFPAVDWANVSDGIRIDGARPVPDLATALAGADGPGGLQGALDVSRRPARIDRGAIRARLAAARASLGRWPLADALRRAADAPAATAVPDAIASFFETPGLEPLHRRLLWGQMQQYLVLYADLRGPLAGDARARRVDRSFLGGLADAVAERERQLDATLGDLAAAAGD